VTPKATAACQKGSTNLVTRKVRSLAAVHGEEAIKKIIGLMSNANPTVAFPERKCQQRSALGDWFVTVRQRSTTVSKRGKKRRPALLDQLSCHHDGARIRHGCLSFQDERLSRVSAMFQVNRPGFAGGSNS